MVLYGAADRLLLLLLHLGRVQPRGHGGEPAQVRRLPAGHPAGQAHGGVLDFVLTRLTVIGAAYIAIVCLLPEA
jgi:hypothetical protein